MHFNRLSAAAPVTPPPAKPAVSSPSPSPVLPQLPVDTVQLRRQLDKAPFQIDITGEVNTASMQQAIKVLEQYERWYRNPDGTFNKDRVKQKPVQLRIDSPGGSIMAGLGLIDKIESLKNAGITVETVVYGLSASMGALISSSGSKGHRYAGPNSTVMIHQASASSPGGFKSYLSEVSKDIGNIQRLNNIGFQILKNNMNGKMSDADLKEAMRENHYMDAETAKSVGLIDHIGFPAVKGFDEAPPPAKSDDKAKDDKPKLNVVSPAPEAVPATA